VKIDRRTAVLGLSATALPSAAFAIPKLSKGPSSMIKPELEFVYEASGDLGAPIPIGDVTDGTRRIIPIFEGGRVEGPLIKGQLWAMRPTGNLRAPMA